MATSVLPPFSSTGRGPRVAADAGIPFGPELREDWYRVLRLEGPAWTAEALTEADALCVRSTTRVGPALLTESPVRFVGTVTSGVDHLDLPWLKSHGIAVYSAPGSNAVAVAEYVLANLYSVRPGFREQPPSIGIIGCGNVGEAVARRAALLGFEVLRHDPPRAAREPAFPNVTLEAALAADVVTLHVPLEADGPYPTTNLLSAERIADLAPGTVVVNAARGGVLDEAALAARAETGEVIAIIDCWCSEPTVDPALLRVAAVATPHIAGHTIDAKRRGARWIARALDEHFAAPDLAAVTVHSALPAREACVDGARYAKLLRSQVEFEAVTLQFRASAGSPEATRAAAFRALRQNAGMRQEVGLEFRDGWRQGTPVHDPHLPTGPTRLDIVVS